MYRLHNLTMDDETIFIKFLGRTPVVKVLDFFIDNDAFDYSKTDIAKGAGISIATLFDI